ncbi:TnsA-like heteromeric transposase endonuclease subunit [Nocardia sp. NPDC101769]|uniref:TnsA-like heteromeric transposase endonuclease subunit n=1 Tax=Nocardia sp. NPDC101769 TaxID=3364333 RepID=UPI0037FAAF16
MADAAVEWGQASADLVELDFVDAVGAGQRLRLSSCAGVRFEDTRPVRRFRWSRGLGHFPGWWWTATTGLHVGYESWLERDHLRALDFDREVVGVASQPFWLRWEGSRGRQRRHAPDYFARLADGTGVVIDVRADDRIEDTDLEAFAVTAEACALLGWEFRRVGEIDAVWNANVRWLARYRHPRCTGRAEVAARLREVFAEPAPLLAGAEAVGDRIMVLPALFHLMWHQELVADLARQRLELTTMVRGSGAMGGRE